MREFSGADDFSRFISSKLATLSVAKRAGLEAGGEVVAEACREIVGHYQDGWPDLAESTVREKERLGYAPPDNPLLREGDLRDSYGARVIDANSAEVGSPLDTAVFHELGTVSSSPKGGNPPRPVLGIAAVQHGHDVARLVGQAVFGHMTDQPGAASGLAATLARGGQQGGE